MACAAALGSISVACSDDEASSASTVAVTLAPTPATGSPVADPAGDGPLTVGVLLPLTGPGSEIGTVMRDAVEQARNETEAAGVQFRDVDLLIVDETTLQGAISPTLAGIFAEDVDAVIGPASSLLAERLLPVMLSAGVLTCSPTANAMSLDDFPDPGPLFVRTIPSDSMQATALAIELDSTGVDVVLAYVDDAYGRPFMEQVRSELVRLGASASEIEAIGFDPTQSDYEATAQEIVATGRATIGIIGDHEAGPRLVQYLAEEITPEMPTSIWMNDAMRVPATANAYRRLAGSPILELMAGVSPRSTVATPAAVTPGVQALPDGGRFFAANAYDCMNVIALAADQAESISGRAMADQVVQLTNGGTQCGSFIACIDQLRNNRAIDYDGPAGDLDLGPDGDPRVGVFDVYRFDERGLDVTAADPRVTVGT
jgi:branched-chain amino acid transport system substrate-binding protein